MGARTDDESNFILFTDSTHPLFAITANEKKICRNSKVKKPKKPPKKKQNKTKFVG